MALTACSQLSQFEIVGKTDDDDVYSSISALRVPSLEFLSIMHMQLNDNDLLMLLFHHPRLKALEIQGNNITIVGYSWLVNERLTPNLEFLNVRGNPLHSDWISCLQPITSPKLTCVLYGEIILHKKAFWRF
jgi:hypothetical protein